MKAHKGRKFANLIKGRRRAIGLLENEIEKIALENIPDYHFLDYKVSDFWECNKSPIGMCIFPLNDSGFVADNLCRYCGDPNERK